MLYPLSEKKQSKKKKKKKKKKKNTVSLAVSILSKNKQTKKKKKKKNPKKQVPCFDCSKYTLLLLLLETCWKLLNLSYTEHCFV